MEWSVAFLSLFFGSQFLIFYFVFQFLILFSVPSSLIRCDILASCTLFEVLDCVYICPWPGDCSQRESGVVTLEN